MPIYSDFYLSKLEDGIVTIAMSPAVPIGGWNINFNLTKRENSSNVLIKKTVASGYSVVSGITIQDSGQGIFSVRMNSNDTSGFDPGNYAYEIVRMDSGFRSILCKGYLIM